MTVNEIINNRIANELGLKNPEVEKVIKSMFNMLTTSMEDGDLRPIRMQYLGLWECKPLRVEKLKEKGYLK